MKRTRVAAQLSLERIDKLATVYELKKVEDVWETCSLCDYFVTTYRCAKCGVAVCFTGAYEQGHVCPCQYKAIYWCWRQVGLDPESASVVAQGGQ